ncbi:MAG: AsmA family protein [bacterium]|jgi:hypothetical protein|nr:AsmA family protein [Betaproteobacteria bacterium]
MHRKLSIAVALLACILLAAAGATAWWIQRSDPAELAATLAQRVEAMTGRSLRIDGPVEMRLLPRLRIVAEDVAFANARWGTVPDMVRAGRIEAEVSWLALLRGEVRISRLVLDDVDAILETDARGAGNWTMAPATDGDAGRGATAQAAADEASPLVPSLGAVRIERARLRWRDGVARKERRLDVARLSLARIASGADRIELDASVDGQAFQLAGTVPDSGAIRSHARNSPVDLVFSTEGVKVAVHGRFSFDRDGPLDLKVAAGIQGWRGLSKLSGAALSLPSPVGIEFHARGRGSALTMDPLVLDLANQALRGSASWQGGSPGGRPRATLELSARTIDLSGFAPPAPDRTARDRRLFPETRLPFALLAAHDLEATVRVATLRLRNGLEVAPLAIKAGAKNGRAWLQATELRLADGGAEAMLDIEASTVRPVLRLKASGSGLSLEKLTASRGGVRLTGGSTAFALDYTGTGSTPRALAASATGELQVSTGPARIGAGGLDFGGDLLVRLFSAINPFHAADRATELHCAAARLPARAGVVTVDRSIAYETRRTNVVAAGRIDLRDETLDLVIRPTVKEGLGVGAGQLAQLVRVTGALRAPGLALDAAGTLRAAASVGGAVATGGLSLIAEALLNRRAADPAPCRTALSGPRAGNAGEDAGPRPAANPARSVFDGARRLLNLGR